MSRAGERIALPPRTFELLLLLVRRYPHLVRRHEILDAVWPNEHVTDQTLTHRVLLLRQALGDHAEAPSYVAGERGWGYRLKGPVARLDAPSSPATQSPRRPSASPSAPSRSVSSSSRSPIPAVAPVRRPDLTLAVKPLVGGRPLAEMRSVATDLTEALQARLAGLDGARVLPWSAGASPPDAAPRGPGRHRR